MKKSVFGSALDNAVKAAYSRDNPGKVPVVGKPVAPVAAPAKPKLDADALVDAAYVKPKLDADALVDAAYAPTVADMQKQVADNHAKLYPSPVKAPETPVAPAGFAPNTKGLSTGAWVGIAAGGVAVLGLITFLAVRKR